jgi:regulator of RNase E activity RraA
VTVRYAQEGGTAGALIARGARAGLADRDVWAVGQEGDVGVFDCGGAAGASVMGGLSGRWARRLGIAGAVVDGAVRDVESIQVDGVPVWSRKVTPLTGKHRMRAIEMNGIVSLAGHAVRPGDLIAADASGVCIVPRASIGRVLELCVESDQTERAVIDALRTGASKEEVDAILAPERV